VAVLAYADVFLITAELALVIVPLAFFFSAIKVQGGAGGQ
jgi:hypothetical protein